MIVRDSERQPVALGAHEPSSGTRHRWLRVILMALAVLLCAIAVFPAARGVTAFLVARRLTTGSAREREAAWAALGDAADRRVIAGLISRLSGDRQTRQNAVDALARIGAPAKPQLMSAIARRPRTSRAARTATGAALALGTMGAVESVPLLVRALDAYAMEVPDDVYSVQFGEDMEDALASMGPAGVHDIVQSCRSAKTGLGGHVYSALLEIASEGGLEAILSESNDPAPPDFMYDVWLALGDARALPAFVRRLQSAQGDEGYYYALAVGMLGGAEAKEQIRIFKDARKAEIEDRLAHYKPLPDSHSDYVGYVLLFLSREYGRPSTDEIAHSDNAGILTWYERHSAKPVRQQQ